MEVTPAMEKKMRQGIGQSAARLKADLKKNGVSDLIIEFTVDTLRRPVDLLEEKTIKNPYFLKAVENQRQLIYGH